MSATMLRTSAVRPAQLSRAAPRRCAARTAVVTRAANIVETAVSTGKHKTLVAAVTAAGLAETLSGGNFTLFAPTDEAFAKLPAGTLESLLKPENKEQLTEILLFHVCKGKSLSKHVANAPSIPSLFMHEGKGLPLTVDTKTAKPGLRIGQKELGKQGLASAIIGGLIVTPDVLCDNGIIHVVDAVLLPQKPLPGDNGKSETYA